MTADPNAAVIALLSWAATYLIHSTALVAGVWLFLRLRRSTGHALREILWKTALVGGVLSATAQMLVIPGGRFADWEIAVAQFRTETKSGPRSNNEVRGIRRGSGETASVWNPDERRDLHALETGEMHADIWITEPDAERGSSAASAADFLAASGTLQVGRSASAVPEVFSPHRALQIALIVLAVPVWFGLASYLRQTLALRRKLAGCIQVQDGPARRLLEELRRSLPRSPQVRLLAAADDAEPAAFGIRRWSIILPRRALHELHEDELRALLAHELAHLARGDGTWLWISRVVCSLLAFQPLNHLARREWQRSAEFLCDNWAVSRTGAPLSLARCLAAVASWRVASRAATASLAATGRRAGLVDRIERLLDARPKSETWNELRIRRSAIVMGAALLGMLIVLAPRLQIAWGIPGLQRAADTARSELARGPTSRLASRALFESEHAVRAFDALERLADERPPEIGERATEHPRSDRPGVPGPLESLDRELLLLQQELDDLRGLLRKNADPHLNEAAVRLQAAVEVLQTRRDALQRAWTKSFP